MDLGQDLQGVQVVLVPGLRDEHPGHWQSLLAAQLQQALALPARGKANLDLAARMAEIESAVAQARAPVVVVGHSAGATATLHWALRTRLRPRGLLLATPPVLGNPLPAEYPALADFEKAGWLPLPRARVPMPCIVAASRNDPLGDFGAVAALARDWGALLVDLGAVGHLNPASGYGPWAQGQALLRVLALDHRALEGLQTGCATDPG